MAKSPSLLSTRARERKKKKLFRSVLLSFFLLAALATGLVFASRAPQLQIASFEISGTTPADDAAIRAFAAGPSIGTYLFVIPKSNIFLYPVSAMPGAIVARFPEIASASVARKGFDAIEAAVVEKKPAGLWCGSVPPAAGETGGNCFFLDASGEAYRQAPEFSVSPYFQYYGALATSTLPAAFLPPSEFSAIQEFSASISDVFPPISAYHNSDGDFEFFDTAGTMLKVSPGTYSDASRYLKAFLSDPGLGTAQNRPDKFSYIDLRFGKKAYYMLRQPAILPAASSSPAVHS